MAERLQNLLLMQGFCQQDIDGVRYVPQSHVSIRPETEVAWVDWQKGGGHTEYRQLRNLGSAVLQRGNGEEILFVLNHYPEAARFELAFGDRTVRELVDLDTQTVLPVRNGKAIVDVDRKSGAVFKLTKT